MNFIERIMQLFFNLGEFIGNVITALVDFLAKPLAFLLQFLEGIFYFIAVLFQIVVLIISIFVALFQYLFSIVGAFFRTIASWIGFVPSSSYALPYASREGFEATMEQVGGTGMLTVIPNVMIAIIWIYFAFKIIGLIGSGRGEVK